MDEHYSFINTLRSDKDHSFAYDVLTDSRMLKKPLTKERIEKIASYLASSSDLPKVKLAMVVSNDAVFGMSRMFEMLYGSKGSYETEVFRDMDEALAWLGRTRADIEEQK